MTDELAHAWSQFVFLQAHSRTNFIDIRHLKHSRTISEMHRPLPETSSTTQGITSRSFDSDLTNGKAKVDVCIASYRTSTTA